MGRPEPDIALRCRWVYAVAVLVLLAPEVARTAPALVARQISESTAATDLFSGSDASGGVGDWFLSNGVVEAIVDDVGFQVDLQQATGAFVPIQTQQAVSGGTLVDLGLVGHDDDQITSIYPLLNTNPQNVVQYLPASFVLGNPALASVVASVDATEASLTVYGFARLGPNPKQLTIETRYSVRSGEHFVRIRSTLKNTGTTALPVTSFGDTILHGRGGTLPFTPAPGRGFALPKGGALAFYHTVLGRLGPQNGIADTDAMTPAGEVSYTFTSDDGVLFQSGDATVTTAGKVPSGGSLAPGASSIYARRIYVGDRNDAAASVNLALADISTRFGIPMGRVRGRLVSPGGDPFRASLTVTEIDVSPQTPQPETMLSRLTGNTAPVPITHVFTDSSLDGAFEAVVPIGRNELSIRGEERDPIGPISFTIQRDQVTDLGDIALSSTGRLAVQVDDAGSGAALPARITLLGLDVPTPELGVPLDLLDENGAPLLLERKFSTPYKNVLYTESGHGDFTLRPGHYRVVASHGIEYDMAWADVLVAAGTPASVALAVQRAVAPTGWVSADMHVHASPSADSSVPPEDRVRSFAAEGVQVIGSADHDFIFDYAPLIARMGLVGRITSIVGTEVTTVRPVGSWSSGVGHFNGWPLVPEPHRRKNGAPEDEQNEPNVLYDRLRGIGAQVVQMNHPFSPGQGFLGIIGFDPTRRVDVPPNDVLLRTSALGTGTTNLDFDAVEIYNGLGQPNFDQARDAWFNLLNQGFRKTGMANSDTHDVSPSGPGLGPGSPRSYVAYSGTDLASFDTAAFDASLKAGAVFGTSGPILDVQANWNGRSAGLGGLLGAAGCCGSLRIRVKAPCWMPVGEVRVYANGALLVTDPVATACTSAARYDQTLSIAPSRDTWYVVEVRELEPRPPPANLAQQIGQLVNPTVRFRAFSNPIFVDVDGNGRFDAPGLGVASAQNRREPLLASRAVPQSP